MTSTKLKSCDCSSTNQMADILKALGHPVRLRIVQELTHLKSCCCADMCECFSQSQSTISQHLSVLKEAGIISFERQGNKSLFTLNHDVLSDIQTTIIKLFNQQNVGANYD